MPIDRLSGLLERFRLRATLHHTGQLCGAHRFDAREGHGYLHVLRRGRLQVRHSDACGLPKSLRLEEPTLLFYPRPLTHQFLHPPREGADFTCARLSLDDGRHHPLIRALPPLIAIPIARVPALALTLELLFAEADHVRCGHRLLADRIFEVLLIQLLRWLLDHPGEAGIQPGLINGLSDPRLARVLTALHENPGHSWTLRQMTVKAGMSRTAFAALFRKNMGQTPADYLGAWRIALAQRGLRDGGSIKMLAGELGYANPSALSRAFTARTGMAPRAWLKSA